MKRIDLILIFLLSLTFYSCNQRPIHPTVVIGGGLMGSSVAWQLSERGEKVILLEQQDKDYDHGSSQGKSRIARSLGPKDDIWGWLHNETVDEVKQLVQYLNRNGVDSLNVNQIYTTSPVTYVRNIKQLSRIEALMYDGQPDRYEFAGQPKMARQLFGMNIPDSVIVIREFKKHSGTINPSTLIPACHQGIRHSGNEVRYRTRVDQLTESNNIYRIDYTDLKSNKRDYILASKVVTAAGPWSGSLLKFVAPYADSLLSPKRVFLSYLKIADNKYAQFSEAQKKQLIDSYPLINSSLGTRLGSNFSMIDRYEDGNPVIKIGGHFQRSDIPDLATIWNQKLSDAEINWCKERIHQYLSYLDLPIDRSDIEVVDTYSCVYTLTQNEVPYISYAVRPNGDPNRQLIIMAGLSGVGGKGSLMYGNMAADLIQEVKPQTEMSQLVHKNMGANRLNEDIRALR